MHRYLKVEINYNFDIILELLAYLHNHFVKVIYEYWCLAGEF
jgi:hypothetical protein